MKKHLVIAYFLNPGTDWIAVKTIQMDWSDRDAVRDFARQSNEWLAKKVGNRVLTETMTLP